MGDTFLIAAYRSRQAVIRLDNALRRNGVQTDIVSTPKAVAIGCGLSVKFNEKDLPLVRRLVQQEGTSTFIGFYRVMHVGGKVLVSSL